MRIRTTDELPSDPFAIVGIDLTPVRQGARRLPEILRICRKHLQRLKLNGQEIADEQMEGLEKMKQLQELALPAVEMTPRLFERLRRLECLERLDLGGARMHKIERRGAVSLSERAASSLRELNLAGAKLSDHALQLLAAVFPNLQMLDLSRTRTTDRGLQHLAKMRRLRVLRLDGAFVTQYGRDHLRRALPRVKIRQNRLRRHYETALQAIHAGGRVRLNQGDSSWLERLEQVPLEDFQTIGLATPAHPTAGEVEKLLTFAQGMEHLQILHLKQAPLEDSSLKQIAALKTLRELDLSDSSFCDQHVASLQPLQELEQIVLNGVPITSEGVRQLQANHPQLKPDKIEWSRRDEDREVACQLFEGKADVVLTVALRTSAAEELELTDTEHVVKRKEELPETPFLITAIDMRTPSEPLDREVFKRLRLCAGLRRLNLSRSQLNDGDLIFLAPLRNLVMLDVSRTSISDAGLATWRRFSDRLRNLNVKDTRLTARGVERLKAALIHCRVDANPPKERRESVARQILHRGGWLLLADEAKVEALRDLPPVLGEVRKIDLHGVDDVPGDVLVKWLKEFPELRGVNLTGANIRDDDLAELAKLKHLQEVDLTDTRITEEGLEQLRRKEDCDIRYSTINDDWLNWDDWDNED